MPHVVLNGNIDIKDIFRSIDPLFIKTDDEIIKTSEFYISKDENNLLIKTLSIEKQEKISFLILLSKRDDGVVIRLFPEFDVPKTTGVKKSMAEVAKLILKNSKELKIGKTNLHDYL